MQSKFALNVSMYLPSSLSNKMHKLVFISEIANKHIVTYHNIFKISGSTIDFDTYDILANAWPRGYKTFSKLNSAEHEIYPANKC